MKKTLVGAFSLWMSLTAVSVLAQHRDFPVQVPKDPRTTEIAGIASYHLVRHEATVVAEAFDAQGSLLAECKITWPPEATTMNCTMADGQRFQARWYERHFEFVDLATGDHFSLHFEGRPSRPSESSPAGVTQAARDGWSVRGGRSWEEVEATWGHVTPLFGYLLGEVEITLGLLPSTGQAQGQRLRINNGFEALILCPDGELFCNSANKCPRGDLGSTPSSCCTKASNLAEGCCLNATGLGCCANTLCTYICPFGAFCDCFLDGWQYDCQPNCE